MKKGAIVYIAWISILLITSDLFAQNVGVGIVAPVGKLHIKGTANTSQLIIDANGTQSNTQPILKFRNSSGTELLWMHSDDVQNTFLGLNAGRVNTIDGQGGGLSNSFIGSHAGYSNTNGASNSAVGYKALYANTTGSQNTATGSNALEKNITGNENTACGSAALFLNTTGSSNTAVGGSALSLNTWGNGNTAIGNYALFKNEYGFSNTAVGISALVNNELNMQNHQLHSEIEELRMLIDKLSFRLKQIEESEQ